MIVSYPKDKRISLKINFVLILFFLLCLTGEYALSQTVSSFYNASIYFSDGRTGTITYNDITNTSNMHLSDGSSATTSYNDLTHSSHTRFSDGTTASSSYNELTKNIYTNYSNGLTASTHYNDLTDTLSTTFSDGSTASTTFNEITRTSTTTVFGIFLLPSMGNIHFDPKSEKLKTIKESSPELGEWLKSKPSEKFNLQEVKEAE